MSAIITDKTQCLECHLSLSQLTDAMASLMSRKMDLNIGTIDPGGHAHGWVVWINSTQNCTLQMWPPSPYSMAHSFFAWIISKASGDRALTLTSLGDPAGSAASAPTMNYTTWACDVRKGRFQPLTIWWSHNVRRGYKRLKWDKRWLSPFNGKLHSLECKRPITRFQSVCVFHHLWSILQFCNLYIKGSIVNNSCRWTHKLCPVEGQLISPPPQWKKSVFHLLINLLHGLYMSLLSRCFFVQL